MARWSGDQEQRIFGEGGRHEEERRRAGGWREGGRESEDRERGRERWTGGEPRGEEWREREPERWSSGGEYGRGTRGGEWDREREERGGWYGEGRQGEQRGRSYGEGLRGGGREMGEPSYGGGGLYGGSGGMYGGYGYGRERGGEWRGGGRDTSRDFGRELRGRDEEEGTFERMGDRMREGWRKLTGRGPKGYKRSDERIREDVSERIARSGVNAEDVEVKVEKGEVTLTGFVDRREEKRMIEDIADDVFGVDEVNNHLRIRREEQRQTFGAGASQTTQGTTGQGVSQQTQPQPGRH